MRRVGLVALACAGVAVGVLAEQQAYEWPDLRGWLPDLLAGWTLIGLGLALLALRRSRGSAALLLVAGFSWFAFNFETTGPAAVQWLAVHAAYLHRGPLLHLALAPPAGRPRTRLAAAGVALAWVAAVVWPLWNDDGTALLLAAVFVVIAAAGREQAAGGRGRAIAGRGLAAAAILCAVIAADAIRSLAGAAQGVDERDHARLRDCGRARRCRAVHGGDARRAGGAGRAGGRPRARRRDATRRPARPARRSGARDRRRARSQDRSSTTSAVRWRPPGPDLE